MALHAARRIALQKVFAQMLQGGDCDSLLEGTKDFTEIGEDQAFIDQALQGVFKKESTYSQLLQTLSPERSVDRIPTLIRSILYLAFFELSQPNALPAVIINEAVELAKRYGEENDSKFVNGVLGQVIRQDLL